MTAVATFPAFDACRCKFATEFDDDARSVRLIGEIDAETAPLLLAAVDRFLAESLGDLTFDLDAVTFADSALLDAIVKIQTRMDDGRADVRLVNPSAAIKRLFLAGGKPAMALGRLGRG